MLGTSTIGDDAAIVSGPSFESGVVKIQKCEYESLTRNEKRAVPCHLNSITTDDSGCTDRASYAKLSMKEQLKKKRKFGFSTSKHIDTSLILGSVAEVERIWSVSRYILTVDRQRLRPQLFEA